MIDKSKTIRYVCIIIVIGAMLLSACGKSQPVKYYTLDPTHEPPSGSVLPPDFAITVGPVMIPSMLDRALIVSRATGNNISFSEYHRWAGSLQKEIARVVAANIGEILGTDRVTPFTQENIFQPTHRVVINIERFDGRPQDELQLDATWSIKALKGQEPLVIHKSNIRQPLASAEYDELVEAHSKALALLSKDIAASFKKLSAESATN
jgi:uncharacterized lipoprotein YmbA